MLVKECGKLKIEFTPNDLLFQSGLSGLSFFPAKMYMSGFRFISLTWSPSSPSFFTEGRESQKKAQKEKDFTGEQ